MRFIIQFTRYFVKTKRSTAVKIEGKKRKILIIPEIESEFKSEQKLL